MWEFDLPHGGHDSLGAQHLIDASAIAGADACIAIFWSTLGAPGSDSVPNSVHELDLVRNSGRPTYVWVKNSPIPTNQDLSRRSQVDEYVKTLQQSGYLTGTYKTKSSLSSLLERVLTDLALKNEHDLPEVPAYVGSLFSASIQRSGQVGYVLLKNVSSTDATVQSVEISTLHGVAPQFSSETPPGLLAPGGVWRELLYFSTPVDNVQIAVDHVDAGGASHTEYIEVQVATLS
ncbi:hypothetical protein [Pseudoclavibacter sp. AY1F1]|uniref:hypothetical protein n=1 Tax=Pseudoclavibacter sp. AY1F1 TaxID=2080583 RepID=UPI0011B07672|nr:hypothetical protein [Pseudoclavibacter sp. AY1F1]